MHCGMWVLFTLSFLSALIAAALDLQSVFGNERSDSFAIESSWEVLGPFESGTREQQWGADPLQAYGGFSSLKYDTTQGFVSSLNGTVFFGNLTAGPLIVKRSATSRKIAVEFPGVDWHALEESFGWSALQFQAWIRGTIQIRTEGRYALWIGGAVEFYLDGTYYDIGNLYDDNIQFIRGGLFLELTSSEHILEIRVVNDLRAFGGRIPPRVEVSVTMRKVEADLVVADYDSNGGWIVASVINMTRKDARRQHSCVAGDWASLALRNEGKEWVVITALNLNEVRVHLALLMKGGISNQWG